MLPDACSGLHFILECVFIWFILLLSETLTVETLPGCVRTCTSYVWLLSVPHTQNDCGFKVPDAVAAVRERGGEGSRGAGAREKERVGCLSGLWKMSNHGLKKGQEAGRARSEGLPQSCVLQGWVMAQPVNTCCRSLSKSPASMWTPGGCYSLPVISVHRRQRRGAQG